MAEKEVAKTEVPRTPAPLLVRMGAKYHVPVEKVVNTLKQTCFRVPGGKEVSDAQMMALMIVADQYGLNPFTREIYAFPDKQGGIVPVVGIDGWSRITNSNPQFDGMEFNAAIETSFADEDAKECPEWIECIMHRKDHAHSVVVREYLDECYRPRMGNPPKDGPWQTHTKRMLRHKAMIQCARVAFGFVGIYDPDEAERIADAMGSVVATIEPDAPSGSRSERALSIASTPERAVERLKADAGLKPASELAEMPPPAAAARDSAEDAASPVSRSRPAESRATGPRAALPDGVSAVELPPKADLDALEGPSLAALCDAYGLKIAKGQGASDRNRDALEALARHRAADLIDDARELEAALRAAHEASHIEALREQWAAIDTELEGLTSYHSLAINRCRITMAVLLQEVATRVPGNAT